MMSSNRVVVANLATDNDIKTLKKTVFLTKDQRDDIDVWFELANNGYDILKQTDEQFPGGLDCGSENICLVHDPDTTSFNHMVSCLLAFRTNLEAEKRGVIDGHDAKQSEGHYLHRAEVVQNKYNLYKKHYRNVWKSLIGAIHEFSPEKDIRQYVYGIRDKITPFMHTLRDAIANGGVLTGFDKQGFQHAVYSNDVVTNKAVKSDGGGEYKDNTVNKKRQRKRDKKRRYNQRKKLRNSK